MSENKAEAGKQRGAPHRFQPGQSGNPGGRPKRSAIRDFFAQATKEGEPTRLERVLTSLYTTAIDRSHRDHMHACELVTAYCFGRPVQAVEVAGEGGGPLSVAPVLEAKLAGMLDALATVTPPKAEDT